MFPPGAPGRSTASLLPPDRPQRRDQRSEYTYTDISLTPAYIDAYRDKQRKIDAWAAAAPVKQPKRPGFPAASQSSSFTCGQNVGVGSAIWSDTTGGSGTSPTTHLKALREKGDQRVLGHVERSRSQVGPPLPMPKSPLRYLTAVTPLDQSTPVSTVRPKISRSSLSRQTRDPSINQGGAGRAYSNGAETRDVSLAGAMPSLFTPSNPTFHLRSDPIPTVSALTQRKSPPVPLLAQAPAAALGPGSKPLPAAPGSLLFPPPKSGSSHSHREAYLESALSLPLDMISQIEVPPPPVPSSTQLSTSRLGSLLGRNISRTSVKSRFTGQPSLRVISEQLTKREADNDDQKTPPAPRSKSLSARPLVNALALPREAGPAQRPDEGLARSQTGGAPPGAAFIGKELEVGELLSCGGPSRFGRARPIPCAPSFAGELPPVVASPRITSTCTLRSVQSPGAMERTDDWTSRPSRPSGVAPIMTVRSAPDQKRRLSSNSVTRKPVPSLDPISSPSFASPTPGAPLLPPQIFPLPPSGPAYRSDERSAVGPSATISLSHRVSSPVPPPAVSKASSFAEGLSQTPLRGLRDASATNLTAHFEPAVYSLPSSGLTGSVLATSPPPLAPAPSLISPKLATSTLLPPEHVAQEGPRHDTDDPAPPGSTIQPESPERIIQLSTTGVSSVISPMTHSRVSLPFPEVHQREASDEHLTFEVPSGSRGRLRVSLAWLRDSDRARRGASRARLQDMPGSTTSPPPVPPKLPQSLMGKLKEGFAPRSIPYVPARAGPVYAQHPPRIPSPPQSPTAFGGFFNPYLSIPARPAYAPSPTNVYHQMHATPFAYPQPAMSSRSAFVPHSATRAASPMAVPSIEPPSTASPPRQPIPVLQLVYPGGMMSPPSNGFFPYAAPSNCGMYGRPSEARRSPWDRWFGPSREETPTVRAWQRGVPVGRAQSLVQPMTRSPTSRPLQQRSRDYQRNADLEQGGLFGGLFRRRGGKMYPGAEPRPVQPKTRADPILTADHRGPQHMLPVRSSERLREAGQERRHREKEIRRRQKAQRRDERAARKEAQERERQDAAFYRARRNGEISYEPDTAGPNAGSGNGTISDWVRKINPVRQRDYQNGVGRANTGGAQGRTRLTNGTAVMGRKI